MHTFKTYLYENEKNTNKCIEKFGKYLFGEFLKKVKKIQNMKKDYFRL